MILSLPLLLLAGYYPGVVGATSTWRPELPWDKLAASITGDLVDTSPSNYLQECAPVFDFPLSDEFWSRSLNGMIDQPSGLCLPHFFCSFENCAPANPDPQTNRSVSEELLDASMVPAPTLYSEMNSTIKAWVEDTSNSNYNLPSKVLFPKEAKDVVAAVQFAKEHGLEISIKNSGHSYTGASSKGNTLHINMNKYYPYSGNDGVVDCDADSVGDDLSDQPCRLSLAKGKEAVIRVGGGENWEKVYKAVRTANMNEQGVFTPKYHAVGGAAGTVSPMGWTFSAGLSATTAGRVFGFGVDQVLHLEMVLPSGSHVRFGPTEWEKVEGYDVPKTLSVSGLCNTNPDAPEESWIWDECPETINFNDLWFAVRGGGGGTWGVVLSMYLQLHEYLPYERMALKPMACVEAKLDDTQKAAWDYLYQTFEIKYLFDPTSINVTEAESNACGWPMNDAAFSCYGEGSGSAFESAWKIFLTNNRGSLEDEGIPSDIIDERLSCPVTIMQGTFFGEDIFTTIYATNSTVFLYEDFITYAVLPEGTAYPGQTADGPQPAYSPSNHDTANIILPKKWILENIDTAAALSPPNPYSYRAFGGKAADSVSDQMNSLSDAHRQGGYMQNAPFGVFYNDDLFATLFPALYDTSDKSNFPGFLGANHAGINTRGPLKSDWTKACPLEWTQEERDEKCISLQECIWGTKLLKRLEAIKEAIDPNYMFDCNGCVGNNRVKSASPTPDTPLKENETSTTIFESNDGGSNSSGFSILEAWQHSMLVLLAGALVLLW